MTDTQFIDGMIVKAPHERAPDYVKAKLSLKREELIAWLQQQTGEWINADIKVSQNGKWYAAVDTWQPEGRTEGNSRPRAQRQDRSSSPRQSAPAPAPAPAAGGFDDDDIPF